MANIKVKKANKAQSVIEYDLTELQNKLTDLLIWRRCSFAQVQQEVKGIDAETLKSECVAVLGIMYNESVTNQILFPQ